MLVITHDQYGFAPNGSVVDSIAFGGVPDWLNLTSVTASGATATTTNTFTIAPPQRFYRIQRLSP